MRILLVSTFFPPQHAVASTRAWSFASNWAEAGEDVTVLTVPKRPDQDGDDRETESFEVAAIPYRIPRALEWLRTFEKSDQTAPVAEGSGEPRRQDGSIFRTLARRWRQRTGVFSAVRMPDLTDFWVRPAVAWAASHGPWDIVYSSAGPYTTHLVADALRRRATASAWIAEFRDLWTENHSFCGMFPFTIRERVLEGRILRNADAIVTISPGLADRLSRRTDAPVEVVYNGYESLEPLALPTERFFRCDSTDRPQFNLVYTGTLYPPFQDPSPLLTAISILREQDADIGERIRVHVAGQNTDAWRSAAAGAGVLDHLRIHGRVDSRTARWMQRDADGLIFLDWAGPIEGILTAKIFEYLASPAPILFLGGQSESSAGQLLSRTGGGVLLSMDAGAIARKLRDLLVDPTNICPSREEGLIRTFSRDQQSRRSLEFLREIVSGAQRP